MDLRCVELHTDRLLLRELRETDWEAVHEWASDPEVVTYMPWGPNTPEQTAAFLARREPDRQREPRIEYELGIVLRDGQRLIGACGMTVTGADARQGVLGYCMHSAFWGHGYMTEAAGAQLRFGFETLGLHRIIATCDTRNIGSWRVMEKNGMRREGHFLQDQWLRGEWRDTYLYAMLEGEWRARQEERREVDPP